MINLCSIRAKCLINGILILLSVLLTLGLFEIGLRLFWIPNQVSGWGWEDSPRRSFSKFPDDKSNNLGLRGQEFKYNIDDFVVLLLGDSQVESATSSPSKMPEKILELELSKRLDKRVKVFSLASSGWGQDQQLLALKRYYKDFRADLVLVYATPGNDFWENAFPDRSTNDKAGRIKPTYLLYNEELIGPFFQSKFYNDFALIHLASLSYYRYKEQSLEDSILIEWLKKLPSPHVDEEHFFDKGYCESFKKVSFENYIRDMFIYEKIPVTVTIHESFKNSRSHFSPYAVKKSPRDLYLINISKALYDEIKRVSLENGSKMFAFYGIREDFDYILGENVKCVMDKRSIYYVVENNYPSLLQRIIPIENLIMFDLPGREEISVSRTDPHLSDIGNKRLFEILALKLENILK